MKTYGQLMTHYWGVIVPMAEAAGIDPWECVRAKTLNFPMSGHPNFQLPPDYYTFALTVLEGRPVFVGDELFANNCTKPLTVKGLSKQYGYLSVGECTNYHIDILSWTPPPPKVIPKPRRIVLEETGEDAKRSYEVMWIDGTCLTIAGDKIWRIKEE